MAGGTKTYEEKTLVLTIIKHRETLINHFGRDSAQTLTSAGKRQLQEK